MTRTFNSRIILLLCLLAPGTRAGAQDSTTSYTSDSLLSSWNYVMPAILTGYSSLGSISHSPEKKDHKNLKRYQYLLDRKPGAKNYRKYYELAVSLWELEKTAEAEKMFLSIIASEGEFYTSTYYHSSDVPGDTATNMYGYGSFSSNYKNYAAKYLVKINLEKKRYDTALMYLDDAVNKYKVTYTCGTGYNMQQNEYTFLYACCYEGLNENKKIIDLLLPGSLLYGDDMLIKAIRNTWTDKEIKERLLIAENSVSCVLDSLPSYTYLVTEATRKKPERTDTITYYSGTATMLLFDQLIEIPVPDLENGEHLSREHFVKKFKESFFYRELNTEAEPAEEATKVSAK